MRRAPYPPRHGEGDRAQHGGGGFPPAQPACLHHPADLFAEAELIAACRRTAAICDRATIALLILAVPLLLFGVLP